MNKKNNKINNNKDYVKRDIWRNLFHIQPPTGLLNDPNGLIYHNGVYHVFYQWHPHEPKHGLKYWNHVTSTDLIHWIPDNRILSPDTQYDKNGAYSGSAIEIDDQIHLFYTGNQRDDDNHRNSYQMHAIVGEHRITEKKVLIDSVPTGYTDHFRDPKVFKKGSQYYMIIGAQRENLSGTALMYTSNNPMSWSFVGEIKTRYNDFGYMWECPDLFSIDGSDVLLFCPQGAFNSPKNMFNIYPNVYCIGQYNFKTNEFVDDIEPHLIDHGFDFYAAQTFLDEEEERVLFAWVGSAVDNYPSDKHGWAHVLSLPRRLHVQEGFLYQTPHPNLHKLRKCPSELSKLLKIYELYIDKINGDFKIELYHNDNGESLVLHYNETSKMLTLDRSNFNNRFAIEFGEIRTLNIEEGLKNIHVFRDTSTIEIFINSGKFTMTSRFFPQETEGSVVIHTPTKDLEITYYELEDINHDL
ncbi:hypothetical protein AOC36_02975 [Erysipelothrix larvae]|uniref:Sucrose-6-phosphate hydrolase n=1 Tax=Erysipelothrix larvae TaxID=1514105 RepID=A0A0X8GYX5_9FIRM|nr:sucrose-6-phosphate hydrolase [Erysipelothrix larvae]AMC92980.1 hypothetical protein AOC36_02975 [Erysipelothrix larvae]